MRASDKLLKRFLIRRKLNFSKSEWSALQLLRDQIKRAPVLFSLSLFLPLVTAAFDVSSIALLGLAINVFAQGDGLRYAAERLPFFISSVLTTGNDRTTIFILIFSALLSQILKSAFTYLSTVVSLKLQQFARTNFSDLLCARIFSLSYLSIVRYAPGWISALFTSAFNFDLILRLSSRFFLAFWMLVGYGALILWITPTLALFLTAVGVSIFLGIRFLTVRLRRMANEIAKGEPAVQKRIVSYIQDPRLVRALGVTQNLDSSARSGFSQLHSRRFRAALLTAITGPAIELLIVIGLALTLAAVLFLLPQENLRSSISVFAVSLLSAYRLTPYITSLAGLKLSFVRALPAAGVVAEFLVEQGVQRIRSGGSRFSSLETDIKFSDVSFRYPGSASAILKQCCFTVRKNSIFGIAGKSGSGKTTLVDLICGIIEPSQGAIRVNNHALAKIRLSDWQSRIGLVDQQSSLLNLTIRENLSLGNPHLTDDELGEATKIAHIEELISSLADGYDTLVGEGGIPLSGGERQRLSIARAVAGRPDLLILDEATSALDGDTEAAIMESISTLDWKCTVLIVAHRLKTLTHCDDVIVLQEGSVVETGSPQRLLSEDSIFSRFWRAQQNSQS